MAGPTRSQSPPRRSACLPDQALHVRGEWGALAFPVPESPRRPPSQGPERPWQSDGVQGAKNYICLVQNMGWAQTRPHEGLGVPVG